MNAAKLPVPRRMVVSKDKLHEDLYRVRIGPHTIGDINRTLGKEKRLYTFEPDLRKFPPGFSIKAFSTGAMHELKQELVKRIPRDIYMQILEAAPEGSILVTNDV